MNFKIIFTGIFVYLIANTVYGQVTNKIVVVESNYRPEVEQVEKLGVMPEFNDTSAVKPEINYSVLPSRLKTDYKIKPIKAAKLVGSPLDELYKSQLKIGLGNYLTPLVEFNIHNLRSKEYVLGAYVFHRSSHSDLELENETKVPAGYSRNRVSLYGKRFFDDVNVEGEVYLNTNKYRFYGYNTELVGDTVLEAKDLRQYYTQLGARAEVYSVNSDSGSFQYRLGLDVNHLGDDFENHENHLHIPMQLSLPINTFKLVVNGDYHLYAQQFNDESANKHVLQIRPQLYKQKDEWDVMVGLNTYVVSETESEFSLYPEARLGFKVVDDALYAYFGVEGNLGVNNFANTIKKNPYILPGTSINDTKTKLSGYGGFKGKLASNAGYLAAVRFSSMDDVHFFVNDSTSELENHFTVVYDKVEEIKFRGEVWYSPYTFLDFYLKGQYSQFSLATEAKPWHVPSTTISFITRYNFKEKIFASFDIINVGKRYAKDVHNSVEEQIELKSIWDLNLKLEYKYSEVLSGFLDVHNILSQDYYIWNQYPSQKINFLAGISYKF